jgi:lysophospholipase L1-like esterase
MKKRKETQYWVIYLVALLTYTSIVFVLGYLIAMAPMSKITKGMKIYTFGDILDAKHLREWTPAYLNPEYMEDHIADVLYEPAKTYAPFVGDIPSGTFQPPAARLTNRSFRIFLTGGSTAFGSGAPSKDTTIGSYLESLLNDNPPEENVRFEVFTYANTAWSSTHERIITVNRLVEWDPDLIISLSGANDVYHSAMGRNTQWFRTPAEETFFKLVSLAIEQTTKDSAANAVSTESTPIKPPIVAARLARNVTIVSDFLYRENIPYIFALQPTLAATHKQLTEREEKHLAFQGSHTSGYFKQCYDLIKSNLENVGSPKFLFMDLTSVFDEMGREDVFIDMFHFGDKGNRIIAKQLAEEILSRTPGRDSHY